MMVVPLTLPISLSNAALARSSSVTVVPLTLPISLPNVAVNLHSTRLALHINDGGSSYSAYIAPQCGVDKIEVMFCFLLSGLVAKSIGATSTSQVGPTCQANGGLYSWN